MTADDPLVFTEWLAAHLDDAARQELSTPHSRCRACCRCRSTIFSPRIFPARCSSMSMRCPIIPHPLPHMCPDAEQFAHDVGALGVSSDDTVVVYDSGGWVAAPRAWWMFLSFGHTNVRVLDGGLKKWRAEGRAIETGKASPKPGNFTATFDPVHVRSKAQLVHNLSSRHEQLIDARAASRFEGSVAEPRPGLRSGHIPGSRNLPYNEPVRCRDRHDETAGRSARTFSWRCSRSGKADRHHLRLRRVRRGADAGAVSPRRPRLGALRRLMVGMGITGRTSGRHRTGVNRLSPRRTAKLVARAGLGSNRS